MSSELITLLEREAAAERDRILAEARAQAEAIVAEARRQAEHLLAAHRERLEAEARAARVRAESTAHLRASSQVLQAKEEEIAQVFARAETELARIPGDGQRYPAILRAFVEEGLNGLEDAGLVIVNPADQATVQAFLNERGAAVTVRADPAVVGGVKVASPDGRFVLTNTLASRLERARPIIAADVARVLWEA
jgi:V/A-type H+-transporting ATPase subunit E